MKTITSSQKSQNNSKLIAYALWLLCLFGIAGAQRFYAGKHASGLLYLLTWGIFGIGQLLDLILISEIIDDRNRKQLLLKGSMNSTPEFVVSINGSLLKPMPVETQTNTVYFVIDGDV